MLCPEKLTKLARDRGGMSETWGVSPALKMFIVHLLRVRTLEIGSIGQGWFSYVHSGLFLFVSGYPFWENLQQGAVIPRAVGSSHYFE